MLLSSKISQTLSILGNDIVIIEGIKDREALNKFGIDNLIEISGRSLIEIADSLVEKNIRNVTILTDFDKEGECQKSQLTNYLSHYGIKINSFARKKIKTLFKIHKIEELSHFTKFMDGDYTGEASPVYDKIFNRSRIHNRWRGGKTRRHRSDIRSN
jgi:5S rRNA maturation endonuclease (ribonuclease M5)